jgi:hypothetical protein
MVIGRSASLSLQPNARSYRHRELRRPGARGLQPCSCDEGRAFRLDTVNIRHVPPIGSFTSTVDRGRLVVAQRDLVLQLVDVADLLEVDLLALAHHVEGVADLQVERLVLRRVVDAVLADELHAAGRVLLVDAHDARRHRHGPGRPAARS